MVWYAPIPKGNCVFRHTDIVFVFDDNLVGGRLITMNTEQTDARETLSDLYEQEFDLSFSECICTILRGFRARRYFSGIMVLRNTNFRICGL